MASIVHIESRASETSWRRFEERTDTRVPVLCIPSVRNAEGHQNGRQANSESYLCRFGFCALCQELSSLQSNQKITQTVQALHSCLPFAHSQKVVDDGALSIAYGVPVKLDRIREFMKNPRFLVVFSGVSIAGMTYLVINPIRNYFVLQQLTLGFKDKGGSGEALVTAEKSYMVSNVTDAENELRRKIAAVPKGEIALYAQFVLKREDIIIVNGEKGRHKTTLIKKVLHRRASTLFVDCTVAESVADFIGTLETAVHFTPSFSSLTTLMSYLESMLPTAKKKDGISESRLQQLKTILGTVSNALTAVGFVTTPVIVFDGFNDLIDKLESSKESIEAQVLLDELLR
jgi:hypothetical protein